LQLFVSWFDSFANDCIVALLQNTTSTCNKRFGLFYVSWSRDMSCNVNSPKSYFEKRNFFSQEVAQGGILSLLPRVFSACLNMFHAHQACEEASSYSSETSSYTSLDR